ncbi:MAG TPA: hypothetical protein VNK89_13020 [Thermoflexus sp.]|nr:hypothetical protein [Thermoflexus sp.]
MFGAEPRAEGARLSPKSPQAETADIRIGAAWERLKRYDCALLSFALRK